jgi:hypothetical protein
LGQKSKKYTRAGFDFKHPISEALTATVLLVHHVVPPLFLTLSISARWDIWQSVLLLKVVKYAFLCPLKAA